MNMDDGSQQPSQNDTCAILWSFEMCVCVCRKAGTTLLWIMNMGQRACAAGDSSFLSAAQHTTWVSQLVRPALLQLSWGFGNVARHGTCLQLSAATNWSHERAMRSEKVSSAWLSSL